MEYFVWHFKTFSSPQRIYTWPPHKALCTQPPQVTCLLYFIFPSSPSLIGFLKFPYLLIPLIQHLPSLPTPRSLPPGWLSVPAPQAQAPTASGPVLLLSPPHLRPSFPRCPLGVFPHLLQSSTYVSSPLKTSLFDRPTTHSNARFHIQVSACCVFIIYLPPLECPCGRTGSMSVLFGFILLFKQASGVQHHINHKPWFTAYSHHWAGQSPLRLFICLFILSIFNNAFIEPTQHSD